MPAHGKDAKGKDAPKDKYRQSSQGGRLMPEHHPRHAGTTYQRKFLRVTPRHDAPVHVDLNGHGFIDITRALDISEAGVRIAVPHRFTGCDVTTPVNCILHFPAPLSCNLKTEGRIMHVQDDSFGVVFSGSQVQARRQIRRYIAAELRRGDFWGYMKYLLHITR